MKIFALTKWLFATIMIFVAMTMMIIIFPFVKKPRAQKITSKFIGFFTNITTIVEGKEDPEVNMFLLNHESDIDIGCMELATDKDLAWVAKKELFDIPFFGLLLKLPNDIAVERESKTSLIKMLKDAKDRLEDNRVITIFPEGTRSSTKKMLKFKPGAKLIADKLKLRVQPVVLVNSSSYYNIKKKHHEGGKIKLIFLDSFDADRGDKEWLNRTRETMQEVYNRELANISSYR